MYKVWENSEEFAGGKSQGLELVIAYALNFWVDLSQNFVKVGNLKI